MSPAEILTVRNLRGGTKINGIFCRINSPGASVSEMFLVCRKKVIFLEKITCFLHPVQDILPKITRFNRQKTHICNTVISSG